MKNNVTIKEHADMVRAKIEQDVYDAIFELDCPQVASDVVSKAWVDATKRIIDSYVEAGVLIDA